MTLAQLIRLKGFTIAGIARRIGVSTRTIENYTCGKYDLRNARAWVVVEIAKLLEVTPDDLFNLD